MLLGNILDTEHFVPCPCPCPSHTGTTASAGIEMGSETTTILSTSHPYQPLFICVWLCTHHRFQAIETSKSLPGTCRLCHTADSKVAPNLLLLLKNLQLVF